VAATIKGCAVDCDACANRPMVNPDNGAVFIPIPPSLLRQHWADIETLRAWHSAPWWRRAWCAVCRVADRAALAAFGEVRGL
jgi:hypothetical protein